MMVHTVYFWLRHDLTDAQRADFRQALGGLAAIKTVKQLHVGEPPASRRHSNVDYSFSLGLLTVFDDEAGRDSYQTDPIHDQFLESFKGFISRVQIYDSE